MPGTDQFWTEVGRLEKEKRKYAAGTQQRKEIDRQYERAKEQARINESHYLAEQPLDRSFMTPEFEAAQNRLTIDPIRRSFGLARQQGLQQSLRTGGPVGALYSSLAGQEGEAIGNQASRNFLTNTETAMDLAGRRFGQNLASTEFAAGQGELEKQREERRQARGSKFGRFARGVAGLAGTALGGGFNPLGFLGGGGGGGGSINYGNRSFANSLSL